MTEELIVGLIALAFGVWIARPLLGRRRSLPSESAQDRRTADLMEEKQSVYRSILDLEMDHDMGKIDEDDYRQLRQQSKAEALGILHQLGTEDSAEADAATLEDEIRAARARMRKQ